MRYYAVTLHECAGETIEAVRMAREAEALAPTSAYRVTARCRRAELASDIGETFAQYDHVLGAREIFTSLDLASLSGEERLAPLFLAEESARIGDAIRAREYLGIYRKHELTSRMSTLVDDRRLLGYERLVEAFVARAAGNDDVAQAGLREAFRAYKPIGYRRLAVRAALGLAELTGQDYLFEYVHRETRDLAGSYWPRRHIQHRVQLYRDQQVRALTHVEREVLMLVCEGKSNREIAKLRGRSEQRIKNVISGLFVAFDVKGRSKLIVECKRRGIPPEP
jgi:DNA-binding CsgD family transcriptional regulator